MPTISLCVITKNEESCIAKCINSAREIVDEIVVVDTGSTDKTKEIAAKFTDKVFDFKWNNDFSEARNFSLGKATKEWILVFDADETIAKNDLEKIKKLTENENFDGYKLTLRNYFKAEGIKANDSYEESKGYSGWVSSELVRLFRNKKEFLFENVIHEVISGSILRAGGKIARTGIPIHHFRGIKDIGFEEEKTRNYLIMEEKQIELTPNNPKPYYELGRLYMQKKDYKKASGLFEKSLELLKGIKDKDILIYNYIYSDLGEAYLMQKEYDAAKRMLEKAALINPKDCTAYFYLGLAYDEQLDFDNAALNYKKSIELSPMALNAYNNLAEIYLKMKEYSKAYSVLKKAIELNHPKKGQMLKIIKTLKAKGLVGDETGYSVSMG